MVAIPFNVENREQRRDYNKERRLGKEPSGADPFAKSKYRIQDRIIMSGSIWIQESLRFEDIRLGIEGRIAKD